MGTIKEPRLLLMHLLSVCLLSRVPPRCGARQDPLAYGLVECDLGADTVRCFSLYIAGLGSALMVCSCSQHRCFYFCFTQVQHFQIQPHGSWKHLNYRCLNHAGMPAAASQGCSVFVSVSMIA